MAKVVYSDKHVTEYDDGTEEAHFEDSEWAYMMADPVYWGYAGPCGHAITRQNEEFWIREGCPKCFSFHESSPGPGEEPPRPDFPVILCGNCKDYHVGIGAVQRCHGVGYE